VASEVHVREVWRDVLVHQVTAATLHAHTLSPCVPYPPTSILLERLHDPASQFCLAFGLYRTDTSNEQEDEYYSEKDMGNMKTLEDRSDSKPLAVH
jgi:hypothetical protein